MIDEEDLVADLGEISPLKPLRASDWFWRPWYAKVWWAAIPIYWSGRWAWLKVPVLGAFYDTLLANYLALFCNPFILLLILGFGFVRAKLDRGDWIITPGPMIGEGPVHIERRPGELLDPYTDFTDPRSGVRYLRYRGILKDHNH